MRVLLLSILYAFTFTVDLGSTVAECDLMACSGMLCVLVGKELGEAKKREGKEVFLSTMNS